MIYPGTRIANESDSGRSVAAGIVPRKRRKKPRSTGSRPSLLWLRSDPLARMRLTQIRSDKLMSAEGRSDGEGLKLHSPSIAYGSILIEP